MACEPAYTSFHGTKGVTVDYIWVSPQVQVVGVWEVLAAPLLEAPHSRLANGECPVYLQKSPISPQKSPISPHKKPYISIGFSVSAISGKVGSASVCAPLWGGASLTPC